MIMEANQQMVELVTKVVEQSQGNNRTPYQPQSNFPAPAAIQSYNRNGNSSSTTSTGTRNQNSGQSGSLIPEVNCQLICYGCGNAGHMSRECPDQRQNKNHQNPQFRLPQHTTTGTVTNTAMVDTEDVYPEGYEQL